MAPRRILPASFGLVAALAVVISAGPAGAAPLTTTVVTDSLVDQNQDGSLLHQRHTVTSDVHGRPLVVIDATDFENDGVYDVTQTESWKYNEHGKPTQDKIRVTVSGDTLVYSTQTDFVYDQFDQIIETRSQTDGDGDGVPDDVGFGRTVHTRQNGKLVRSVFTAYDTATNAPRFASTTSYTYDAQGNNTIDLVEDDFGADGSVDQWQRHTRTFDNRRNKLSEVGDADFNHDNVPDAVDTTLFAYDKAGNIVRESHNGIVVFTRTFDAKNRVLSERTAYDYEADGVEDDVTLRTWVRDSAGNAITETFQTGLTPTSTLHGEDVITRTFDSAGHRLTETFEQFDVDNAVLLARQTTVDTYDSSGRLIKEVHEESNFTGYFYRSVATYSYA